jgi:glycosyltransferase involved in cell wall biosynthesis
MRKKTLLVISNDKIYHNRGYYTSNNDLELILGSFKKKINTYLLGRNSKSSQKFKISSLSKINKISFTDYSFLFRNQKIKSEISKILMISITPFNFTIFLILLLLTKFDLSGFVYLRSDGYKEYKKKYSYLGYAIYNLMFKVITKKLKVISASSDFHKVKKHIKVFPSELSNNWKTKSKKVNLKKPHLLFIGRYKKEKGIFSLLSLLQQIKLNLSFTYVGYKKTFRLDHRTFFKKETSSIETIKNYYDSCNIFILPSYTEGFPKVISESISRLRPVIIFNEIKQLKKNYYGIFCCKRNSISLEKKIIYIMNNYKKIQKKIKENKFFSKKEFQEKIFEIVNG